MTNEYDIARQVFAPHKIVVSGTHIGVMADQVVQRVAATLMANIRPNMSKQSILNMRAEFLYETLPAEKAFQAIRDLKAQQPKTQLDIIYATLKMEIEHED